MLFAQPNPTPAVDASPPASPYNGRVDLTDINNARTIGVVLVPSGSSVLDIGTANGAVAETLRNRHCRVWGVEIDRDAAADAAQWCEQMCADDVEAIDLATTFPGVRFDAVLLLDVLEHLRRPLDTLRKAIRVLAPGGRVIASIPNVAHASVRLQLLAGRFARTETGLLDRTHLQFFDRPAIQQLIDAAGLTVFEEFTVLRAVDQTEIDVDLSTVSPDVLLAATRDPESEVYQYIISAGRADDPKRENDQLSIASFLRRVRYLEREYRRLEGWATNLERQVLDKQSTNDSDAAEIRRLEQQLEHQRSTVTEEQAGQQQHLAILEQQLSDHRTALATREQDLSAHEAAQASLQQELSVRDATLASLQQELSVRDATLASLQQELSARDATLASLQQELSVRDATLATLQLELERLAAAAAEERARQERVIKLLQQDVAVRQEYIVHLRQNAKDGEAATIDHTRAIESLKREIAAAHEAASKTLARPRYRVADGVNRRLLKVRPLHRLLRRWAIALLSRS